MTKHGAYYTKAYSSWDAMTQRCTNPKHKAYKNYGGRGITVCERWRLFENFLVDMGQPPTARHTLDRTNVNLGYSPENCRWASFAEQAVNRRNNRWLTLGDVTKTVSQWAEYIGCRTQLIDQRLRRGWTIERALGGMAQSHLVGRTFSFCNKAMTLCELADFTKVPYKRLHKRLVTLGWDVERAVRTPGK